MNKLNPESADKICFLFFCYVLEIVYMLGLGECVGSRDGAEYFPWVVGFRDRVLVVLIGTKVVVRIPLDGECDLLLFE